MIDMALALPYDLYEISTYLKLGLTVVVGL